MAAAAHPLRSRLLWAGFGPLQGGLWIAPSDVDLRVLGDGLEAGGHLEVFTATAVPPTDVDALVRDAWHLEALAARYRGFLDRWEWPAGRPRLPDALASQLVLQTEWLQVIRRDPRLPVQHLPPGWQRLFRALYAEFEPGARATAAELDVLPDEEAARP